MSDEELLKTLWDEPNTSELALAARKEIERLREKLAAAEAELKSHYVSSHEFFILLQKRGDGKLYPDLHKSDARIYLDEDEADAALLTKGAIATYFHKVRMIAILADEWHRLESQELLSTDAPETEGDS